MNHNHSNDTSMEQDFMSKFWISAEIKISMVKRTDKKNLSMMIGIFAIFYLFVLLLISTFLFKKSEIKKWWLEDTWYFHWFSLGKVEYLAWNSIYNNNMIPIFQYGVSTFLGYLIIIIGLYVFLCTLIITEVTDGLTDLYYKDFCNFNDKSGIHGNYPWNFVNHDALWGKNFLFGMKFRLFFLLRF